MDNSTHKFDPIREKYFRPLERADWWVDFLFYIAAALSVAALLIEKSAHPHLYDFLQIIFTLSVICLFGLGLVIRLYLSPRAQERRLQDFLSSAYGVSLSHEQTKGYYNNNAADPEARVAAQLLENTFHSKSITRVMALRERIKASLYVVIWIVAVLVRSTDLALAGIIAQAIFSEQLLSRFFRIEWFRMRCEKIYDNLFRLFQSNAEPRRFTILAQELLVQYEMVKANAAITLSGKIFERDRLKLAKEWEDIKKTLGL